MADAPVAVVTGASGGIGSAIARALAKQGYRLALMSRSGCREIAAETGGIGVAGSVLADGDVEALVATAQEAYGRIDAAVFSAGRHSEVMRGHQVPAPPLATAASFAFDPDYKRQIFDIPWGAWHDDYEMMVIGPMRLAKAVVPSFQEQGSGAFVAISGIEATEPRPVFPLGPTRLALHGFIKLLADRYGREGLRFNCLVPGLVESAASEFHPGWVDLVPLGRVATVEEIAESVAFLLSPAAGYITGQAITADGGVNRGC